MLAFILWGIGTVLAIILLAVCVSKIRVATLTVLIGNVLLAEVAAWAAFFLWPRYFGRVCFISDVLVAVSIMVVAFDLASKFMPQWKSLITFSLWLMLLVFVPRIAFLMNQPIAEHRIRAFSSICMATSCAFLMALLMFKPSRYQAGEQYKWLCFGVGFLAGGQVVMARIKEAFLFSVAVSRIRQVVWIFGIVALLFACAKFKGEDEREVRAWTAYADD